MVTLLLPSFTAVPSRKSSAGDTGWVLVFVASHLYPLSAAHWLLPHLPVEAPAHP